MPYLTDVEVNDLGFKFVGNNVKISTRAVFYEPELISIGDFSRIDDLCLISGNISVGKYCHITPMCMLAGGAPGIELGDFCTLAYGVKIFSQSDDYSGHSMTNSLINKRFKKELFAPVSLGKHVIVGAGSTILPGVRLGEGCAVAAMSLITKSCEDWGMYKGIPAQRFKERSKALLKLEKEFLEGAHDPF